ncbi:MAG TPA: DUF255 domain-containing protein [Polyangiaceae bacterium]|nr:DUF255 domain-containing protein [Polyangiaceae bacterium]
MAPAKAEVVVPAGVDIAKARAVGREPWFRWYPYEPATFAKAKAEGRYLLLDGAAEWCHWCHVMDETTYRDPDVGRMIRDRFVAVRIDIDARPDLGERYAEWGWPATILLSPDAEEVGKFRGYIPPERLRVTLEEVLRARPRAVEDRGESDLAGKPADVGSLPWVGARVALDLDGWWDPAEGGWGTRQKTPLGANVEFEIVRASHGDAAARTRAALAIEKERSLLDPVWGGLYQYSAASDWNSPHFEKLMTVQAAALEARARAVRVDHDAGALADARAIERYLGAFLSAPDGAFFANQDADVGAHDRAIPFVDGHAYYGKDDPGRRAMGIPWIDTHVYARENGLAIAALVELSLATGDARTLARARKAADRVYASHVLADGSVLHDESRREGPFLLADAAALGRGLARLAEATRAPADRASAEKVVYAMERNFADPRSGALFETTEDSNATGVFGRRRVPFAQDVLAARSLASLARLDGDAAMRDRARAILAAIATPQALEAQGRWLGEFLLALDEVNSLRW